MTENVTPAEVIAFLNGEGPLDGCWFGDTGPDGSTHFWWRKYLALLSQSASPAVGWEDIRGAVIEAYVQGALDVHNNWQEDRDPDFKEAAHDYASSIDIASPPASLDGGVL